MNGGAFQTGLNQFVARFPSLHLGGCWLARFAILPQDAVELTPRLKPRAVKLMIALAFHMGPDGKCWPRLNRLMEITGLTRQHVQKARQDLAEFGLEWKTQKPKPTNYYWPIFDKNTEPVGSLYREPVGSLYREPRGSNIGNPGVPSQYMNRTRTNQKQIRFKTATEKSNEMRDKLETTRKLKQG